MEKHGKIFEKFIKTWKTWKVYKNMEKYMKSL